MNNDCKYSETKLKKSIVFPKIQLILPRHRKNLLASKYESVNRGVFVFYFILNQWFILKNFYL